MPGLELVVHWIWVAAAVPVIGAIDAALHPDSTWRAADQNKIVWVGLQLGGLVAFGIPGFVAAVIYFLMIRPKLRSATKTPL